MTKPSNPPKVPQPGPLPPDELAGLAALAKQQAHKVLGKIPLLGPVTWLMLQQAAGRQTLLGELEWRVMPALILDQAKLYLKDDAPVAFASWARLSEEVVQRYRTAPHQLTLADWASGDQIWLIDVFTPFGGAQEVLKDLREQVFAGQVVHQLVPVGAQAKVMTWPAAVEGLSEPNKRHK
ncbi:cytolysin-activating lysine-acyltransferase [Polaromonas sp. YR568]|uniref:toxin-activating lysine-acyltransferase n=1 Tax=Polaromonas sp. YR568 TaxID=1855301 RepID=UPI0008DF8BE4|nr:toxin-activating lysine-acyltransferase [Polaromonas sp. YR568]SFU46464.1 cytolysin-activating lysine-acyltransferase [Polaromonas sp. YR568]